MTILRGISTETSGPPGPRDQSRAARIAALRGDVRNAQAMLGAPPPALADRDLEPLAIDQAWHTLSGASDELVALLVLCGIETPLGWRLHDLRSRLDAHLLAVDALRDADAPEAAVSVLHRTVNFVGSELELLFTDA